MFDKCWKYDILVICHQTTNKVNQLSFEQWAFHRHYLEYDIRLYQQDIMPSRFKSDELIVDCYLNISLQYIFTYLLLFAFSHYKTSPLM